MKTLKTKQNKTNLLILAIISLLFIQSLISFNVLANSCEKANFIISKKIDNDNILDLSIDAKTNLINASGIYLDFSTSTKIDSIELNKDFCELVILEKIDNEQGKIEILCGTTKAKTGKINIAKIFFQKTNKNFNLVLDKDKSQILAHDGYGTNIFGEVYYQ